METSKEYKLLLHQLIYKPFLSFLKLQNSNNKCILRKSLFLLLLVSNNLTFAQKELPMPIIIFDQTTTESKQLLSLANEKFKSKKFFEALKLYKKALSLNTNCSECLNGIENTTKQIEIQQKKKEEELKKKETLLTQNDSDNDGIIDNKDKCPTIYAKTSDGCPSKNSSTKIGKDTFLLAESLWQKNDKVKAIEYYKLVANQNDVRANNKMAILYKNGIFVNKNIDSAIIFYQLAAVLNDGYAMYQLGEIYKKEIPNDSLKNEWYKKAAESENTSGMVAYAKHLSDDLNEYLDAKDWLLKAVELGDSAAMNNMALLYIYGNGVIQDTCNAYEWFLKAAKKNYMSSYSNIAYMHINGFCVKTRC